MKKIKVELTGPQRVALFELLDHLTDPKRVDWGDPDLPEFRLGYVETLVSKREVAMYSRIAEKLNLVRVPDSDD